VTAPYVLSAEAEADLEEIGDYIARENPVRAVSFIDEIEATCQKLAEQPLMGRSRDELRPSLRSFPHGAYLVFYRPLDNGVVVVRVLHGRRNLSRLL
jgi:toxin ParE1/3/4